MLAWLELTTGLPVSRSNSATASSERQAVHEHSSESASGRHAFDANATTSSGSWSLIPWLPEAAARGGFYLGVHAVHARRALRVVGQPQALAVDRHIARAHELEVGLEARVRRGHHHADTLTHAHAGVLPATAARKCSRAARTTGS